MDLQELLKEAHSNARENKENLLTVTSGESGDSVGITGKLTYLSQSFVETYLQDKQMYDALNGLIFLIAPLVFAKTPALKLQVDANILKAMDVVDKLDKHVEGKKKKKDADGTDAGEALAEYLMGHGLISES